MDSQHTIGTVSATAKITGTLGGRPLARPGGAVGRWR